MNKEEYASDSDLSDNDFCPENAAAGISNSGSEDESDGDDEAEDVSEGKEKLSKVKRKKQIKKTQSKRKQSNGSSEDDDDDDDDFDDDETNDEDEVEHTSECNKRNTRQTDIDKIRNGSRAHEKDTLESDEEDKSRTDALWADFLGDAKKPETRNKSTPVSQTITVNKAKIESTLSNNDNANTPTLTSERKVVKITKETEETDEQPKQVTVVTEILDFAGEEVRVQKTVMADSIKENKLLANHKITPTIIGGLKRPISGALASGSGIGGGAGGLGSLLNQIGKKKKLSVLEKTKLDWSSFKQDEGLDEELQTFNKGKNGFLERQDFLQRTDLRQFEIEKNLRQTQRKN